MPERHTIVTPKRVIEILQGLASVAPEDAGSEIWLHRDDYADAAVVVSAMNLTLTTFMSRNARMEAILTKALAAIQGLRKSAGYFLRDMSREQARAVGNADEWIRHVESALSFDAASLILEGAIGKHSGSPAVESHPVMQNHREVCLCYRCGEFKPGQDDNCPIAQAMYRMCVDHDLVTPVVRCPKFAWPAAGWE